MPFITQAAPVSLLYLVVVFSASSSFKGLSLSRQDESASEYKVSSERQFNHL